MKNTLIDLDFVMVRASDGRLVFMGERKNVKCFDRLKKVSERVFETIQGQTYKFLDKMPELATEPEPKISPEMQARAEAACRAYMASRAATAATPSPAIPAQSTRPLTPEEDWRTRPDIRAEFVSLASYAAYCRAIRDGRSRLYGQGTSTR